MVEPQLEIAVKCKPHQGQAHGRVPSPTLGSFRFINIDLESSNRYALKPTKTFAKSFPKILTRPFEPFCPMPYW